MKFSWNSHKRLVKESFDNLPTGIIFANLNGIILLANRLMHDLYSQLSGEVLRSAHEFWYKLENEETNITVIEWGSRPIVQFADGKVYSFNKSIVQLEYKRVLQIEAVDISQLYKLRLTNFQKNEKLIGLRRKMVENRRNLAAMTREEEVIDSKLKIHNMMGMGLTAIRRHLTTGNGDIDKTLVNWSRSLQLLINSDQFVQDDFFESLQQAAQSIGIELLIKGDWPTQPAIGKVIVGVGRECLINACLHGNAKQMQIAIDDKQTHYLIIFSNDGESPKGEPKPGGGFMTIERLLEPLGGSYTISQLEPFTIKIVLPQY